MLSASFLQKRRPFWLPALLLISTIFIVVRTKDFYFFSDDFLNFIIANDTGLTWAYVNRDVFGQFIPLYRLANLIYIDCFGLHFWPFRALLVVSGWANLLLIARMGAKRHVDSATMFPVLVLLVVSPVFIGTFQWWSAALSVTTSTVASLTAINLSLYQGRLGLIRQCGIAMAVIVGLAFYPKTLFVIILLSAIRLFINANEMPLSSENAFMATLRDLWPTALLVPPYIAIVHFGDYNNHVVRPGIGLLLDFVWSGWHQGFLVNVFGLPNDPRFLTAANLLIVTAIGISLMDRPRTAILWLGFLIYFITSIGVIGWNRAASFGLETAHLSRYYADIICYAAAFYVVAAGKREAAPLQPSTFLNVTSAVITSGLAIYLVSAGLRVPHLWYAGPAKPARFVENIAASLTKMDQSARIADMAVPTYIMPGWMAPLNGYDHFLRLLGWHGKTAPIGQATVIINDDGTFRRPG